MLRKKSWMGLKSAVAVAMAVFVGMLVAGCGSDGGSAGVGVSSELDGIWNGLNVDEDGYGYQVTITVANGYFEMSEDGDNRVKGTFWTSGNNTFTMTPTHYPGYILPGLDESRWYSRSEIRSQLISLGVPAVEADELLDERFAPQTGTYVLSGDNLYLTVDGETIEVSREPGTGPGYTGGGGGTSLVGTWVASSAEGGTLRLNNDGSFEMSGPVYAGGSDVRGMKGTYSATSNYIVLTLTHVHGDIFNAMWAGMVTIESKWYTKNELKTALRSVVGSAAYAQSELDELIDEMFAERMEGTYILNGNSLTINESDGGTTRYTRAASKIRALTKSISSPTSEVKKSALSTLLDNVSKIGKSLLSAKR